MKSRIFANAPQYRVLPSTPFPSKRIARATTYVVAPIVAVLAIFLLNEKVAAGEPAHTELMDEIISQERAGLEALKKGDLAAFAKSTSDSAIFIDPHGLATKDEVMKNVAGFKLIDFSMENVKFVPVSKNSGIIAYKLFEKGSSHDHEFTAVVYVGSFWSKESGEWRCLFSQETIAK